MMNEREMHGGGLSKVELLENHTKKLEEELQKLGLKIKHHEDNLTFLKAQIGHVDKSILDMQGSLEKYNLSQSGEGKDNLSHLKSEQETTAKIMQRDKTAAGIICQMKVLHGLQAAKLPLTKDVLGVVATLGKVNDDNLSRIFSEYLGLETMLAVVCKTFEGVKALEKYNKEGMIDESAGLHGLGRSIGRLLGGRFLVLCLENLRPYSGDFVMNDPQRKLALLNPKLPNGECPPGFLGFAVNLINLDHVHLSCVTTYGHGLRETLFYSLFSRLQVYKSRVLMELAIPCISDGAISLDGGIIRSTGIYFLGDRTDVEIRFPVNSQISNLPRNVLETEEQMKLMGWKRERLAEDMQREEALLKPARVSFTTKKEELSKCLEEMREYATQVQASSGKGKAFRVEPVSKLT